MKRRPIGKWVMLIIIELVPVAAFADAAPMAGENEMTGIVKSLQSPVFLSFWFLWGGMLAIPSALFFVRGFLRVAAAGFGVVMLIIGLVTGAKNYDCCEKCGAKLERWYDRGRNVACPRCNPEVKYRNLPEHIRKATDQQPSGLPGAVKFGKAQKHETPE